MGSVSRFFLKKLREGYNIQSISKAIPFDTNSIVQRLKQLNFIKDGTVTDTGNIWAACLNWHEKNYEAWVCMDSSLKIILPADTELLQKFDSLDPSILRRVPQDKRYHRELETAFSNNLAELFLFLSGQDISALCAKLNKEEYGIRSQDCSDIEQGDPNLKYLVLSFPKGTVLRNESSAAFNISMPVLRIEETYSPPDMDTQTRGKLCLPQPPSSQISWINLLDGNPASEGELSQSPPPNFLQWPSSEWEEALSSLTHEQRTPFFSCSCALSLYWQNGTISKDDAAVSWFNALKDASFRIME